MAKKTPVNVARVNEDSQVIEIPFAEFAKMFANEFKIKAIKNEQGQGVQTPIDIVSFMFANALADTEGNFELPEELEAYSDAFDTLKENVEEHKKALEVKKANKDTEKEKKRQEREQTKAEKGAEEAELKKNQDAFQDIVKKQVSKFDNKKAEDAFRNTMNSINLPKSIALADNGMGVIIGDGATKNDIALATSSYLNGLQGSATMQSALQFGLGDLLNGAVKAKVYRNKGDAAQGVKVNILEATGKSFSPGAIQFYALMSERVPVSKRKNSVPPSVYLVASKITAPRIKEGTTKENEELAKSFEVFREEVIDKINEGELKAIKDVSEYIKTFKEKKGLLKDSGPSVQDYLHDFFLASWIKANITPDEAENFTFSIKNSPKKITMHVSELTSRLEDAGNNLQNILLKDYDVTALMNGVRKEGKGEEAKEVPYFLIDPFGQAEDIASEAEEENK